MHLPIDVAHRGGVTVLSPHGDLDVATGPVLGALIGGRRRAEAVNGSLSLVCADDRLLRVFEMTGLDKVFAIFADVDAVVA